MRFERLVIDRFGPIRGLDTGAAPLPSLVAVAGPNEAGKTTLFQFMVSVLYGFYPATRDSHPYTPWTEGDIEGTAVLRTGSGEQVEVRRRLLSTPRGTVVRGDRSEDLRNRSLPFAEHVPRDLFRQIYALGLSELSGIEDQSWSTLQDRLITGMGARDIRSPLEAAEELEDEAGRLWRSNRRGNQRVRDLDDRIRELRRDRRDAADRDRELREKARKLEQARRSLTDAREERQRLRIREEKSARLIPVRRQLRRIAELEEEALDPEGVLDELPPDPPGRREALRRETEDLDGRLEELEERREELEEEVRAYGARERSLLEREERVGALAARAAGTTGDLRTRIGELEQQVGDVERRCRSVVRELFEVSFEELDPDPLQDLPVRELRERLRRYHRLSEERQIYQQAHRMAARRVASRSSAPLLWGGAVAVAAGVGIVGFGLWRGEVLDSVLGASLLALGGGALAVALRSRGGEPDAPPGSAVGEEAEKEARSAVSDLLSDLPLRPAIHDDPPEELARELERLQELLDDRAERRSRLEGLRDDLDALRERLLETARTVELDLPEDPAAAGHTLARALEKARAGRERARTARRELERLGEEEEELAARKAEIETELEELERALRGLGEGDLEAGVQEAARRREARDRARGLRRELERSHPDLEELEEKIRRAGEEGEDDALDLDDEARAGLRAEIERLGDRIETLRGEVESLETEVEHLQRETTVDEIEGEIETLRGERRRLVRERDRKHLMARLLREADRRFREAHQPDVVQRASEYLALITGGRYDRIILGQEAGEEADLRLREPETGRTIRVEEPLSTGTRQQVYLSFRLAMVDHLDAGGERLPLFLDEAFVNWDARRRERGFALLERTGERRQVFLFTCHHSMARELERRGARALFLEER